MPLSEFRFWLVTNNSTGYQFKWAQWGRKREFGQKFRTCYMNFKENLNASDSQDIALLSAAIGLVLWKIKWMLWLGRMCSSSWKVGFYLCTTYNCEWKSGNLSCFYSYKSRKRFDCTPHQERYLSYLLLLTCYPRGLT